MSSRHEVTKADAAGSTWQRWSRLWRSTTAPRGTEFAELLRAAMLPPGECAPPAWRQFDLPGVEWLTRKPVAAPRAFSHIGPLMREGRVVLMDRGGPSYVDACNRPGQWQLLAFGDAQGVVEVQLSMLMLADETHASVEGLDKRGFMLRSRGEPHGISGGARVWLLGWPQRTPLVVKEDWSSASTGVRRSFKMPYTAARMAEVKRV